MAQFNWAKTVTIALVTVVVSLSKWRLDIPLSRIVLGLASGPSASSTEEVQTVHPAPRLLIVEVIVVPDHLAISVPEPVHDHPLEHSVVRARRAEVVAEAV